VINVSFVNCFTRAASENPIATIHHIKLQTHNLQTTKNNIRHVHLNLYQSLFLQIIHPVDPHSTNNFQIKEKSIVEFTVT